MLEKSATFSAGNLAASRLPALLSVGNSHTRTFSNLRTGRQLAGRSGLDPKARPESFVNIEYSQYWDKQSTQEWKVQKYQTSEQLRRVFVLRLHP